MEPHKQTIRMRRYHIRLLGAALLAAESLQLQHGRIGADQYLLGQRHIALIRHDHTAGRTIGRRMEIVVIQRELDQITKRHLNVPATLGVGRIIGRIVGRQQRAGGRTQNVTATDDRIFEPETAGRLAVIGGEVYFHTIGECLNWCGHFVAVDVPLQRGALLVELIDGQRIERTFAIVVVGFQLEFAECQRDGVATRRNDRPAAVQVVGIVGRIVGRLDDAVQVGERVRAI